LAQGLLAAVGLLAIAAVLSTATYHATDHETVAFYLAAAVLATWFGGLPSGAVIIAGGSALSLHTRSATPGAWETETADWTRFVAFAVIASAYIVLLERVRSAGRALARSLEQQRAILDLLPVGVAIVRPNGHRTPAQINPAMSEMFGFRARTFDFSEPGAAGIRFAHDGAFVTGAELPLNRAMTTGIASRDERIEFIRPDGVTLHIRTRATPLVEHGEPRGAIAVYVDETEAHDREARLEEANRAKDEFLGMISHEMKTPLTIISGNAEILERRLPADDEMMREALQDVRDASGRLLSNVENLLTLARIGDRALELEPFPLRLTLDHVVAARRASAHPINLRCPAHAFALGVPEVVEQVLENLLTNALKYSPPDETIEVAVRRCAREFEIAVRDRGAGVPPGQLEAVFAAFYRSPDTSDMATGMGVGLAVCRSLVAAMGGRMWASSRAGGGTEFIFTLAVGVDEQDAT
jgi:signal transduction histidine kinase